MSLTELTLEQLKQKVRLSDARCDEFVEACKVCLEEQDHVPGVILRLDGIASCSYVLKWDSPLNSEVLASWEDREEATEHGACALACLIVLEVTQLMVVRRSRKKTGVDYWLAHKDSVLIQETARLEISGIRSGTQSIIQNRLEQKKIQTQQSDAMYPSFPAYVVIVEFSHPVSIVEIRNV